jgi:hypothetical protein
MTSPRLLSAIVWGLFVVAADAWAQSPDTRREIQKAAEETFPRAARNIEENIDVKVVLEVDAASFGDDRKAWSNLSIVANRIVGALGEIGKDQAGKDAIARAVKKVIIVKLGPEAKEDAAELKDGTLLVKTTASDDAMALLQGVIVATLEKGL